MRFPTFVPLPLVTSLLVIALGCKPHPRLANPGGATFDGTGNAVAISGDWAFVAAFRNDSLSSNGGKVLVYRRASPKWGLHQSLVASESSPSANPNFGWSVDVSSDRAIVGEPGHAGTVPGITGAAYIYELEDGNWVEKARLLGDSTQESGLGLSVAIDRDYAVVGAPFGPAPDFVGAGKAYVYRRNGSGTWERDTVLVASDALDFIEFGTSVDIDSTTVVVGAIRGLNDGRVIGGAAYVYRRTAGWTEVAKLTALDATYHDWFGTSVSISGNTIVVGAEGNDELGDEAGAAYIFRRTPDSDTWTESQKLLAPEGEAGDEFGRSVSVDSSRVIVGAWLADVDTTSTGGRAWLFVQGGSSFGLTRSFKASPPAYGDGFGFSVSVSGACAVVGAVNDDVGDKTDVGSAYMFCGLPAMPPIPEVEIDIICCWQPPDPAGPVIARVRLVNRGQEAVIGKRRVEVVRADGGVDVVSGARWVSVAAGDSVVERIAVPAASQVRLSWQERGSTRVVRSTQRAVGRPEGSAEAPSK